MHLVRFPDGTDVKIIAARKQAEPLVNNDLVHHEISESVSGDADTDEEKIKQFIIMRTEPHQDHGRNGEDDKEPIVLFEEPFARPMMILVQRPEKTVHYKAMRDPRNAFHEQECTDGDQRVNHDGIISGVMRGKIILNHSV